MWGWRKWKGWHIFCKVGELPFNFLGIPIGANPRLRVTWKPVIKKMRDRLLSWRSMHLSLGGRVTLINSVLASLPLYYLSFFKLPKAVLKEMVQIQRNFLWGGSSSAKKMAWIRWSKVCVSKESGGLGIRNLELFNLSLLGKWRWKMMVEREVGWCKLLNNLYGLLTPKQASVWWKDINKIDEENSLNCGWFKDGIKLKIGDGKAAKFWNDEWIEPEKIKDLFPNLDQIAGDKFCLVAAAESGANSRGRWSLSLTRELSIEEQEEERLLLETLHPIS